MIKFTGHTDDGRLILGFGLSKGNMDRLLAGQPIRVVVDAPLPGGMGIAGMAVDVIIVGGETESSIEADFKKHNLV